MAGLPTTCRLTVRTSTFLVVVEAVRRACVKSFLPGRLEPDDVVLVQVRRNALEDAQSKVSVVTLSQQAIASVLRGSVIQPSPEKITVSTRRADVAQAANPVKGKKSKKK